MRIGILTGGGDAPGLNAAIRAVTRRALVAGDAVVGVRNGWSGLMGSGDLQDMGRSEVAGILQLGGTVLGTSSRDDPLQVDSGVEQVTENFRRARLDALVAIGGDGTLSIADRFVEIGLPVIGIPKTIDNDLSATDYCIGFDSAVSRVAEALDRLHTTAAAHHRVMVVEVMGRDTGWLATIGGLAGGADMVIIPEFPVPVEEIFRHLRVRREGGSDFSIVVVSEGADPEGLALGQDTAGVTDRFGRAHLGSRGLGERLANLIESRTGVETRTTVLGHTQRGGPPSSYDRIWATRLGLAAYDMAVQGKFGGVAVLSGGKVTDAPFAEVSRKSHVPRELYDLAQVFY